jgi:hypothetical protein
MRWCRHTARSVSACFSCSGILDRKPGFLRRLWWRRDEKKQAQSRNDRAYLEGSTRYLEDLARVPGSE